MQPLANLFVKNGISAMTFDYSGHGSVGFDNATNGQIVKEIKLAIDKPIEISNIKVDKLILLGHSMGACAILEAYTNDDHPLTV